MPEYNKCIEFCVEVNSRFYIQNINASIYHFHPLLIGAITECFPHILIGKVCKIINL